MYWLAQWQRNAELEDQRLQVSNFVIAASVVGLGLLAASETAGDLALRTVGAAVALSNVMAIVYSGRSAQWARVHKQRARLLLEREWPYFDTLQERAYEVKGGTPQATPRPHDASAWSRREMLQRYLHGVLVLAAVVLSVAGGPRGAGAGSVTPPPTVATTVPPAVVTTAPAAAVTTALPAAQP